MNSKAGRKRQALCTCPPPSSALSLRVFLQQAAFCFGCFCCFLQIECLSRKAFVLERIVSENRLVILPVNIDAFLCVHCELRSRTKQTPYFASQHQNFQIEKFDFYLRILNYFLFVKGNNLLPRLAFQIPRCGKKVIFRNTICRVNKQ